MLFIPLRLAALVAVSVVCSALAVAPAGAATHGSARLGKWRSVGAADQLPFTDGLRYDAWISGANTVVLDADTGKLRSYPTPLGAAIAGMGGGVLAWEVTGGQQPGVQILDLASGTPLPVAPYAVSPERPTMCGTPVDQMVASDIVDAGSQGLLGQCVTDQAQWNVFVDWHTGQITQPTAATFLTNVQDLDVPGSLAPLCPQLTRTQLPPDPDDLTAPPAYSDLWFEAPYGLSMRRKGSGRGLMLTSCAGGSPRLLQRADAQGFTDAQDVQLSAGQATWTSTTYAATGAGSTTVGHWYDIGSRRTLRWNAGLGRPERTAPIAVSHTRGRLLAVDPGPTVAGPYPVRVAPVIVR